MRKQLVISSIRQIQEYKDKIIVTTNEKVENLFQNCTGIGLLRKIKFLTSGFDPLFDESMNFIEQVNQTFTYLVCLRAVEQLLIKHPGHNYFVNFGTEGGYDVVYEDESIVCECFASTAPDSNKKLENDVKKVYENITAINKYVIFYASSPKPIHVQNIRNKYVGVEIVPLDRI